MFEDEDTIDEWKEDRALCMHLKVVDVKNCGSFIDKADANWDEGQGKRCRGLTRPYYEILHLLRASIVRNGLGVRSFRCTRSLSAAFSVLGSFMVNFNLFCPLMAQDAAILVGGCPGLPILILSNHRDILSSPAQACKVK